MNKNWLTLVITGVFVVVLIIAWDVFLTFTGFKTEFFFNLNEIDNRLYGPVEQHLRTDPSFSKFELQASQQLGG